ncbi:MAG: hypothetical protein JW951_01460 [Lentisphaerae bacterium]|nr:hypothetical protein [Lentisphaerota bacterium]
MSTRYRIDVFGKEGCDKCKTLNRRLDKLLADEAWADFEKQYHDIETEPGIIAFCEAECLNPQRIPALLISTWDAATNTPRPLPNPAPGQPDPVCGKSRFYASLGLQTDYSESGRGVITPDMLTTVLRDARAATRT